MATRIMVVDVTGNGEPPGLMHIEGVLSYNELKNKALRAIRLVDVLGNYYLEVKNEHGIPTNRLTSLCTIFVLAHQNPLSYFERFFRNPFGINDALK